MPSEGTALRKDFLEAKMKFVQDAMAEQGIDLWIVFTREGNQDPVADDLRFGGLTWRSAALLDADGGRSAVVASLEKEAVERRGFYSHVDGYGSEGAAPMLRAAVDSRKPRRIAVNTSEDYGTADGLSGGMRAYLQAALKDHRGRFVGAEDLVIALRGRLIPKEVELLKRSIAECEKIYGYAESEVIRPGRTDTQIHHMMRERVREAGLDVAWGEDHCPSVLIGHHPGGHLGYRGATLKEGQFLKLDFGVKYQGYCSDIQRCYYVGKRSIPSDVRRMFETARWANDAALARLAPGAKGFQVDAAARRLIVRRGYPEFMHATGHPVGRNVHEVGPLLGPKWPWRYGGQGSKPIEKDMVFTIEPTVAGGSGTCNLEQDVITTPRGYEEISTPERELIHLG